MDDVLIITFNSITHVHLMEVIETNEMDAIFDSEYPMYRIQVHKPQANSWNISARLKAMFRRKSIPWQKRDFRGRFDVLFGRWDGENRAVVCRFGRSRRRTGRCYA